MLDPRDPNNEIHLVLTPFEAAALLRNLQAEPNIWEAPLAEIAQALRLANVRPAYTFEIITGHLEPTHA